MAELFHLIVWDTLAKVLIVLSYIFSAVLLFALVLYSVYVADVDCCGEGALEQNQPWPDIERGTHLPEALPREPPHQLRSRHSQIWGPVVPYNSGTMQGEENQICSICLEEFRGGEVCRILFRCDHTYHQTCIDDWLNRGNLDCPLCRSSVTQGRNPDSGSNF